MVWLNGLSKRLKASTHIARKFRTALRGLTGYQHGARGIGHRGIPRMATVDERQQTLAHTAADAEKPGTPQAAALHRPVSPEDVSARKMQQQIAARAIAEQGTAESIRRAVSGMGIPIANANQMTPTDPESAHESPGRKITCLQKM